MTNSFNPEKVNLNNQVWFRLTERGSEILAEKNRAELEAISELAVTPEIELSVVTMQEEKTTDGVTQMSLWEFANIFGKHMVHGFEIVVEKNSISFIAPE